MKNQGVKGARRLIVCQLGLTVLLATIAVCFIGTKAAISALLGGLVSLIPNALFARTLFKYQGAHAAKKIVSSFYKGEAAKIILSIVLFVLVFKFFNIIPLMFFAAFILVQMVFWFAPLIFDTKQNRPESD